MESSMSLLLEHNILLEQHILESRKILRESLRGLDSDQQRVVEGIYNEFRPLIEASLTADQIKGLFGEVEKQAMAGGSNRTIIGAGVDVAKQADAAINLALYVERHGQHRTIAAGAGHTAAFVFNGFYQGQGAALAQ